MDLDSTGLPPLDWVATTGSRGFALCPAPWLGPASLRPLTPPPLSPPVGRGGGARIHNLPRNPMRGDFTLFSRESAFGPVPGFSPLPVLWGGDYRLSGGVVECGGYERGGGGGGA